MCQRLVCQKREFAVRSSSCEVNDPKLNNEIFVRIDMKHSYFSNFLFAINFSAVETVVVYQKLIHIYAYILAVAINNKSNFVYILVHRNILMYVILACHLFI